MEVTCRPQDVPRFEALGFVLQTEPGQYPAQLVDEQANYAHGDEMPGDIPYTAQHGAGSEYGHGEVVCDGREFSEVSCGTLGGYVLPWDFEKNEPDATSVANVRRHVELWNKAVAILEPVEGAA